MHIYNKVALFHVAFSNDQRSYRWLMVSGGGKSHFLKGGSPGRWTAPVDSRTPRSRGNKTGLDRLFKLKKKNKKQRGLEVLEGSSGTELGKVRVMRVDMVNTLYNNLKALPLKTFNQKTI